jgi:MFS family permease
MSGGLRRGPTVLFVLWILPGGAAPDCRNDVLATTDPVRVIANRGLQQSVQPVDPATLAGTPGAAWAAASFALVLLFGGGLLYRYGSFVDRSVDASMDRPYVAVAYGVMAFGLVAFVGGYAASQLIRVGVGGTGLLLVVVGVVLVALVLGALGFLVVGTLVTDVQGRRRPWYGLVLGAALSAVGWLLLPLVGGGLAWVVLAAFGIGGPTRLWFHTPRRVDPDDG